MSVSDAKALGVPYGTTVGQATSLGVTPGSVSTANGMKVSALQTAKDLMAMYNAEGGNPKAVGSSRLFYDRFGGGAARDFVNKYDTLHAQLELGNVNFLKGQGQISEGEREILARASTELKRDSSEKNFGKVLQGVIDALSSQSQVSPSNNSLSINGESQPQTMTLPNGMTLTLQADGTYK